MTLRHRVQRKHMILLWSGVLSLVLGFPLLGFAMGYGNGHHPSGHSPSPHGAGTYGHGSGGSLHKSGHGPHQSASKFIEHILKFKEGMAITDDQAAKLQTIKTEFEKTKIRMKADMQLASLDLHELLRNDQGDLSAIESKLKNLFEIRAGLYLASVKAGRDAKAVLTDEQRARMKAVHDRINAYKEGGMTQGHPGGYPHHSQKQQS
ncbi:MAG: Spy/CpxP family protein refolding chaperone [Nitrospirota bacterium]|nr:Spy/CpxP family protein refolding chaperone [Nitrospirota bacterium]MDH5575785.1 Spy/CpxP family protein refolding chaperone [Nitrospirota bacterium]